MRLSFGGDMASWHVGYGDTATDPTSQLIGRTVIALGGIEVTFWSAVTAGTRYTDLTDAAGTPITAVTTSAGTALYPLGVMPQFYGPDNVAVMWAQPGAGARVRVTAVDAYNVFASQIGDVTGLQDTLTGINTRVNALEAAETTQNTTLGGIRTSITTLETARNVAVAELRASTATTLAKDTWVSIPFASESVDNDPDGIGGHSLTSNTTRYTARYAGIYLVAGSISYAGSNAGSRYTRWLVNGVTRPSVATFIGANQASATSGVTAHANTMLLQLAAGDYLELQGYQSSGGDLATMPTGEYQSHMSVVYLRPVS